jgi:hypothetical protein
MGVGCIPVRLVSPAPDLPDAVQHLTRNAVVLHHRLPDPEAAELPLDHEGPYEVGCPIQQGMATLLRVRLVRFGIDGPQGTQSLPDLAAQDAKRMRLLLREFIIKHAPARLRLKAGQTSSEDENCHLRSPQRGDGGKMVPQP